MSATVIDPKWRDRVLGRLRGGQPCSVVHLVEDVAKWYVLDQPDLPMIASDHECDCEHCTIADDDEVDWDDPVVMAHHEEGKGWAKQVVRELAFLGLVLVEGNKVSRILPSPVSAPHRAQWEADQAIRKGKGG